MRWHILRTLLYKEFLRHAANRGALALVALMVAAALLLSFFGKSSAHGSLLGGTQHCYVDYWEDGPWVDYLRQHVPDDLKQRITIRDASKAPTSGGQIVYPPGTGAIQIRTNHPGRSPSPVHEVRVWHGDDPSTMAPYEAWFWRESHHYVATQTTGGAGQGEQVTMAAATHAEFEDRDSQLQNTPDPRSSIATSLVLFGLFFVCVYLLPSLTCEERERGVLLAQALSPASPAEILTARFLFYPVVGLALAAVLAGIYQPAALMRPFFWMALVVTALGSMSIGLTIASVARSQRTASMGALCYLLCVALILVICQQGNIPFISWLALEYHCPRMLQAVMSDHVQYYWGNLLGAAVLAGVWAVVATKLFRRYGWQ